MTTHLGVYPEMSNEDYHSSPGISKSGLDLVSKCPALYKARYIDGVDQDETPAMRIGSAAHAMILQPDEFPRLFAVRPQVDGRTKEGKAIITRFAAEHQDKTVLTQDE